MFSAYFINIITYLLYRQNFYILYNNSYKNVNKICLTLLLLFVIIVHIGGFMDTIKKLTDFKNILLNIKKQYEKESNSLAKGNVYSQINRYEYFFIQYQENKKMIRQYLGKDKKLAENMKKQAERNRKINAIIKRIDKNVANIDELILLENELQETNIDILPLTNKKLKNNLSI